MFVTPAKLWSQTWSRIMARENTRFGEESRYSSSAYSFAVSSMLWPQRRTWRVRRFKFEVREQNHVRAFHGSTPQQRFDSHHQLCKIERLAQVIIGAGFEVPHLVLGRVASREHENRKRRLRAAHESQQFGAADVRQHQIQNQQIILTGFETFQALTAINGMIDREALGPQAAGREFRQFPVVLHRQQSHRPI
jgi:hypothetical protein